MNKYLIVVIYMVAGCAVAVPVEDISSNYVSSEIWAEFSELVNSDAIINSHNTPKNANAAVAAVIMKAENGKLLVSSLYALTNNFSYDALEKKSSVCYSTYESLLLIDCKNKSSIQIRGPGLC